MATQIDSIEKIHQLKKDDIIYQITQEGRDEYQISTINNAVVMAYKVCDEVHFKAFPVMLLISEHWYVEKENIVPVDL
jgi:hypothetical protein